MGRVILESMIWFDLILQWLDIPNLTQDNIHYGDYSFYYTADVQAKSIFNFISLPFSLSRCWWSCKLHSKSAQKMGWKLIKSPSFLLFFPHPIPSNKEEEISFWNRCFVHFQSTPQNTLPISILTSFHSKIKSNHIK